MTRPYAIVLNGNYASLAPYYSPVFEKAIKEADQQQLRRFPVEQDTFAAANVCQWLPSVPGSLDNKRE